MSIFRNLNRKNSKQDKWKRISSSLCKGLEHLQKSWFDYSIRMLKKSSIPLINTQFGGKGELAIKAYQLYFVSCIIAAKNYVPREEAQAFMNSLYPKAWGRKEKACLVYYNRYLVTAGLRTKMALELCVFDIAEYIAGKDIGELEKSNPEAELMITGALNIWSDIFTIWTTIMVASAFQDHKTASELKAKVNSALADLKK